LAILDLHWHELDLFSEDTLRGDSSDCLAGVLAIGEPVVFDCEALAKAGGDEPDAEMALLAADYRFTYLRLALSMRSADDIQVRFVSLDVTLHADSVCWSMQPLKIEQEVRVKGETKVSGKFKLKLLDLGAEEKDTEEYVAYQPLLEAFGLQRSDPAWELQATPGKRLHGIQLFHMVVRIPHGSTGVARVSIRADIRRRGFLFNYRARRASDQQEIGSVEL